MYRSGVFKYDKYVPQSVPNVPNGHVFRTAFQTLAFQVTTPLNVHRNQNNTPFVQARFTTPLNVHRHENNTPFVQARFTTPLNVCSW
jgi:hypothetical protein